MRVFLTGATGFIGSAIARELIAAGHDVLGLARNDAAAAALAEAGVTVHRGELSDLDSLVAGVRVSDGVIHTAFIHDFSIHAAAVETDLKAIGAMADALTRSGKPFIVTSATALLSPDRTGTEVDEPVRGPRTPAEQLVMATAKLGVRASAVRLPPSVHGKGDHGFVPALIGFARRMGVATYVGDGANRWPAVHRLDAARLFRLALEKAAPGTHLHAVAEEGIPMRQIAEAIGAGLGVPVRSITAEEAPAHFDWMARFISLDNPTTSTLTQRSFAWTPSGPDLLTDMRENGYFD